MESVKRRLKTAICIICYNAGKRLDLTQLGEEKGVLLRILNN